jgi:hypothetical protein
MPAGNRTGPRGMGPMTGRGAGYCSGYEVPGYANPGAARAFRMGWGVGGGWGRGWRHRNWYYATGVPGWARWGYAPFAAEPTREQETEILRKQADWLKQELDNIGQRLAELETKE